MAARVGLVLSGCGVFDGSEIHEAVSMLIALDRRGAQVLCMAPNLPQEQVVSHLNRKPERQTRNVMEEAARIARGKIRDIAQVQADELDALIFPGGYGAVMNLCTFAADGPDCRVNEDLERLMLQMHEMRKPIGLACIAPVIAARVFGSRKMKPRLTIGTDRETASAIEKLGGEHHRTAPTDAYVDEENLLVSTACYMNEVGPWTVYQGAERMVEEVVRLTGDTASMIRSQMGDLRKP